MKRKIFLMLLILLICITSISTFVYSDNSNIQELKSNDIVTIKSDTNENIVNGEESYTVKENPDVPRLVEENNENNEDNINLLAAAAPAGCLDFVNAERLAGWAWRPDLPNNPIDIHVYFNNITTGQNFGPYPFSANFYRADLQAAGIGNGYHGFDLLVNWNDFPPGLYDVVVYAIGDGYNPSLTNCPMNYTVTTPTGSFDVLNDSIISGWAWNPSDPNQSIDVNVHVYKDATSEHWGPFLVPANIYRQDLADAGIGNGYHKFEANIEWSTFPPGSYRVVVRALGGNGIQTNSIEYDIVNTTRYYTKPGYAYAVGGDFGIHGNTTSSSEYAKNVYSSMGYNSVYDNNPTRNAFNGYNGSRRKVESNILFIIGHGNKDNIVVPKTGLIIGNSADVDTNLGDGYSLLGTNAVNWKNVDLAILAACYTGKEENDNETCISRDLYSKGADVTIGFFDDINMIMSKQWCNNFNDGLSFGNTVNGAINYANSFNYILDNDVKNVRVSGNGDLVFRINSNRNSNITNISNFNRNNVYTPNNDIIFKNNNDINNITNALENVYQGFDSEDYEIEINGGINQESPVIDYIYKLGDFYTESAYTVFVENGKVSKIFDNTVSVNIDDNVKNELENYKLSETRISEYKSLSKDEVEKQYGNELLTENQESILYYDLKENKKYVIISNKNVVKDESGLESISINSSKYEIE